MKKIDFAADELRSRLEELWGRRIVEFRLLTNCSRLENFAVRCADGERLFVKCAAPPRPGGIDNFGCMVAHLKELESAGIAQMVGDEFEFRGRRVLVTRWCEGVRKMPHQLDRESRAAFIRQYGEFSQAMQRCTQVLPPRDNVAVLEAISMRLENPACSGLRRFIERETVREDFIYDPARLRVIHGDLHHGNFHFAGGRVSGFFDLEEFRFGYPADDLARYIVCGAEHQLWFDAVAGRRTLDFFREMLPLYPRDEWREAVLSLLVRKFDRRLGRKGPTFLVALNLTFRLRLYRRMLAMIDQYAK